MLSLRLTFRGGIMPPENKEVTKNLPIVTMPPPEMVVLHLSQHTGAPSIPIVRVGERVKRGQKIGEIGSKISVPTHSPISGIVKEIKELPHPISGERSLACIIESDGEDAPVEKGLPQENYLETIKEAGIVGLGGAAFPTWVKLSPPKPVETLILNGCECEPYLTGDARTMVENPGEVLKGASIMAEVLNAKLIIVAIEENNEEAVLKMKESAKEGYFCPIEFAVMKRRYPLGSEKQLIFAILKREVPVGKLPYDVGASVQNVQTAFAVYEAVSQGKACYERCITVAGHGVKNPKNVRVRVGTPVSDIISFCGGYTGVPKKVIFGGPLMGRAIFSCSLPVVKATTGILVFGLVEKEEAKDCIRCGRCVSVCPMSLLPTLLYQNIKRNALKAAAAEGVSDCIECGSCAYVCPAKIRLVENFKMAKALLAE